MAEVQSGSLEMLREQQAARYLALTESTLRAWRLRGCGPPYYKLGAAVRYRLADLDAWIAASRRRSTGEE